MKHLNYSNKLKLTYKLTVCKLLEAGRFNGFGNVVESVTKWLHDLAPPFQKYHTVCQTSRAFIYIHLYSPKHGIIAV